MSVFKVADNSLDYSLGNTTKQALWLPTSREAKYKAKQAVDSFFVRAGDVLQAGVVFTGERLAFAVPTFAAINVVLDRRVAGSRRDAERVARAKGGGGHSSSATTEAGRSSEAVP